MSLSWQPSPSPTNLWQILQTAMDLARWKPAPADGIITRELRERAGTYYILKNPNARTYLRLSPREYWLWQKLDGKQSIQDLVVAFFLEYQTFAFGLVVGLGQQLYLKQMLRDQPQFVFIQVSTALNEQSAASRIARPVRALLSQQWVIRGLDRAITRLHQLTGWLVFSRLAQWLYAIASIVGVALYLQILGDETFRVAVSSNVGINIVVLWLLTALPVLIHELGHALTAKHHGREVHRGGFMLSFGLPAAFVDTTDIWLEPKRARISVAWAGSYTGFILAGICAPLIYLFPTHPLAPLLFQVATIGLVLSILNLNPALNLDGYQMLSDAVEIPRLNERSFAFLRHAFLPKLLRREKWARAEIIYVVFGALVGLWTLYFIFVTLFVWRTRALESAQTFLRGLDANSILLARVALLVLALAALLLLRAPISILVTRLADSVRRLRLFAGNRRAALGIAFATLLLVALPELLAPGAADVFEFLLGVVAIATSAYLARWTGKHMRGSPYARGWTISASALILFGIAHVLWWLPLPLTDAFAVMFDLLAVIGTSSGFGLAARLWLGLGGSWRAVSIGFLVAGWLGALGALFGFALFPAVNIHAVAGLLFLGGLIHWHAASLRVPPLEAVAFIEQTPRVALMTAFKGLGENILAQVTFFYGAATRTRVEAAFDAAARQQGWEIKMRAGTEQALSATSSFVRLPAPDLGEYFAVSLGALLRQTARVGGTEFARRALARSYDALDWELREIASEYLFPHLDWASALSADFRQQRHDLIALLQRAPLFAEFNEPEIKRVAARLRVEHYARRHVIVEQGEPGDKFYLLRHGHVQVLRRDAAGLEQPVGELVTGDYFGERALLTGEPRSATIRALTPVEALTLSKKDFDKLIRAGFQGHAKVDAALQRVNMLRRIPVFADFDVFELRNLSTRLERQKFREDQVIVQQGDSGDRFYVVESGQVAVRVELPGGQIVETARLGAGEFFGEVALLMDVPRTATVVTTQATHLLSINAADFKRLVSDSKTVNRVLERAATRRLHSTTLTAASNDAPDAKI